MAIKATKPKKELKESRTLEPKAVKVESVSKKVAVKKATAVKKTASVKKNAEIAASQAPRNDEVKVVKTPKVKIAKETAEKKVDEIASVQNTETRNDEVKETPKVIVGGLLEQLFEAGAHYGHVVKKWNPKMKKYLWGAMNGIHIFDLEKTVTGVNEAVKTLTGLAASGKRIVLVGTKRQAKQLVEDEAKRIGVPYITQRWLGGLITNWRQVKLTIDRLNKLKKDKAEGNLKKYTKKEQVLFDKQIARLERVVGGISTLKDAPEVVVVFDTHKEKIAVKEAGSRGAMVIGLVDSNANPDKIDIVIPMNDDSAKGLEILISTLGKAIESGMKEIKKI